MCYEPEYIFDYDRYVYIIKYPFFNTIKDFNTDEHLDLFRWHL